MLSYTGKLRRALGALAVAGVGLGVSAANADLLFAHLEITAETTDGVSTYTDTKTYDTVYNGDDTWTYNTSDTDVFTDQGLDFAWLNPDMSGLSPEDQALHQQSTGVFFHQDPIVNLNFSVQANNTTTTFTITSALLTFSTINAPTGQSSASFAVSDTDATGVTLTGAVPSTGGMAYRAAYNGFAGADAGTTFAAHIQSLTAGAFGSNSATESQTPVAIGTPISDISSKISFTLTGRDLASGSTSFEVVPEPATLSLLALGLALIRRR